MAPLRYWPALIILLTIVVVAEGNVDVLSRFSEHDMTTVLTLWISLEHGWQSDTCTIDGEEASKRLVFWRRKDYATEGHASTKMLLASATHAV